jgi:DNA-binding response OmpR family regulator
MIHYPKRVLIVEDNGPDVKLLKDLVEWRGYETLQTGDGLEADQSGVCAPSRSYPDGYPITRRIRAGSDPSTQR